MNPDNPTRTYTLIFLLLATAGIGYLSYRILTPFLAAIAWAIVLAVAFQAPWNFLERKMPRRRALNATILTIGIALIVLLPAGFLGGALASQIMDLANRGIDWLNAQQVRSFGDIVKLPAVTATLDDLTGRLGISPADFQKLAAGFLAKVSSFLAAVSGKLLFGVFDALLTFLMTIFLLFFFLLNGRDMAVAALELLPMGHDERRAVGQSLRTMLEAIFRGSLLCALVQGVSGTIGWWLAGLPSPALAGAAMAVLSLLPVGGTAIVWLPGSIWAWTTGRHSAAIFLFVWGLVVTSFLADNVLRPFLIRGSQNLSTLIVFLGVFGGLAVFGLLGIFIGPMTLALAVTLLEILRRLANPTPPAGSAEPAE